jgi:hypothetical protein
MFNISLWCTPQQDASGSARLSRHAKVVICGREVSIRMVDNPGKSQLIPAMMVVVLLDLTNKVHVHVHACMEQL